MSIDIYLYARVYSFEVIYERFMLSCHIQYSFFVIKRELRFIFITIKIARACAETKYQSIYVS